MGQKPHTVLFGDFQFSNVFVFFASVLSDLDLNLESEDFGRKASFTQSLSHLCSAEKLAGTPYP